MLQKTARQSLIGTARMAEGWTLERLTPPSNIYGANGLRTGPDGRIYVAQVAGSQISAIDPITGQVETISAIGGDIVAPDDLAFAPNGDFYATEVLNGRITARGINGRTRVLRDDLPAANGITFHQGRLFVDECRPGGRLMELDLNDGAPRVLLDDIPMPNALEVGPDGMLYFPVMGANEIWRINPEGGAAERVVGDLGVPDAVKFDSDGFIVSTQAATGQVLRIDPRNGDRTVLASLQPGLDNLTFVGDRLFVSHLTNGQITEILVNGTTKALLPGGLCWPLDIAMGADGALYLVDNAVLYRLAIGGELEILGMMFSAGWPGNLRGIALVASGEFLVTTTSGKIVRYRPGVSEADILAEGYDELYGIAIAADGAIVAIERATGNVISVNGTATETIATGLDAPMGVAIAADGTVFVSETGAGRIVKLNATGFDTVIDGLQEPHGLLEREGKLYIVDVGAKTVIEFDLASKTLVTLGAALPIGAPAGTVLKPLLAMQPFSGPLGPFSGITAGPDGTLYVSADGEGSVIALRPSV